MNYKKIIYKKIQKLLTKKKFNNKDTFLFEIYINIYLILHKKREISQIFVDKKYSKSIIELLNKYYPFYKVNKYVRFILYHPTYNIRNLNETFTKKFALQLGDFYKCAGNLNKIYKKYKILLRPVIIVIFKKMQFELYAQMCPPLICAKNLVFFEKITKKINKNLKNINKDINVIFDIQLYH
jgi:hypothetical protein